MVSLRTLSRWSLLGTWVLGSLCGLSGPLFLEAAPGASKRPFTPGVERLDPGLDELIAPGTTVERLATGFSWSEGPVWWEGALLFSDVPENTMYRWEEGQTAAEIFLKPSGTLPGRRSGKRQGSNGLGVDAAGNLLICQHGERRLVRLGADGNQVPLATHFEGKRLNSPNDLVVARNGDVYFTDPPYGLEGGNASAAKELDFNGVFRLTPSGTVEALVRDLTFPNGVALSPDERTLYVGVSDPKGCRLMAYERKPDGQLGPGRLFFDGQPLVEAGRPGLFDGLKVGREGHLFVTGPGGVLVLSPRGQHLGTILTGVPTGNCAWGEDGGTLFITADATLCRIRTRTRGAGWK